jgi:SHS2 domain-containing protein
VYRWVEHTGELELHVQASTLAGVFGDALAALAELLAEGAGDERIRHELALEAPDPAALLAEFLEEVVFLAETRDFVPERARALDVDGRRLHAILEGSVGSPPHLVKAVTYHGLKVRREDDGFHARAVLDV